MAVLNSKMQLMNFFGVPPKEFEEFWLSLNADDRYYYRTTDLKTGLYKGATIRRTDWQHVD